eukprot:s1982_g11.t1
MIEVFAGAAVLCAVSKQAGLAASIAIDKIKKKSARSTIFQMDLLRANDRDLLFQWLHAPMLLWVHLAPVCGTASRAREIRRFEGDPKPLRSNEFPHGLPDLGEDDQFRIELANSLFEFACECFILAANLGVLATLENPRNSYFWMTCWLLAVMRKIPVYFADFQVCMLGGNRDKWTRIMASFPAIQALNIRCDHSHAHAPWGFARNSEGQRVWATSLESEYPKKMCVAMVTVVLQFAEIQGLKLRAQSLEHDTNPLVTSKRAQISVGQQPKPSRLPPVVADFTSVAVFLARSMSDIPCALMSKLEHDIQLYTKSGLLQTIPKYSRFLRVSALPSHDVGVSEGQPMKKAKSVDPATEPATEVTLTEGASMADRSSFEVAFGLPWSCETFLQQACKSGHPASRDMGVPADLEVAVNRNVEWTEVQLSNYRIAWCRRWLARAHELEELEKKDADARHPAVAELTAGKRLLLTREMLEDVGYEDVAAINLLSQGATLAGEVEESKSFDSQFKPCLITLKQLESDAARRNELVLQMTCSSGSEEVDLQMIQETEVELAKGWAEGPFELEDLEPGSTISRRFPLVQASKTRMIDDFSVSGVNVSCLSHNKVDLHLVDTFCSMVKMFYNCCDECQRDSSLLAKTYDLTSAYRQVPVCPAHYKYAYVSVYNCKRKRVEIYRMRTMPFGATHSVYCFLRLARSLFALAVRGLYLLTTNFYDDFILATQPSLRDSAKNSMELLFMLTGWLYAREGKKATDFSAHCKALGVEFDFSRSEQRLLLVANTEARKAELVRMLEDSLAAGKLEKQLCLVMRGKLGFADSFLHGRLGKLVLKKLIDHAYGRSSKIGEDLKQSLQSMVTRLKMAKPKAISVNSFTQWCIYTDASYEPESMTGGLGGVLVDMQCKVKAWFGISLNESTCKLLGAGEKGTIIYELELLAAVLALSMWHGDNGDGLNVHFGDNDGVRFSLIKAAASGVVGQLLMEYHLKLEALVGSRTWFARVPTEANISDFPSRGVAHPLLVEDLDSSLEAGLCLDAILAFLNKAGAAR